MEPGRLSCLFSTAHMCRVRPFSPFLRRGAPHVNFLGHMRTESFLLPSKESFNVVKAVHHLIELRFSCYLP